MRDGTPNPGIKLEVRVWKPAGILSTWLELQQWLYPTLSNYRPKYLNPDVLLGINVTLKGKLGTDRLLASATRDSLPLQPTTIASLLTTIRNGAHITQQSNI